MTKPSDADMHEGDPYATGKDSVDALIVWLRTVIQGATDAGHDTLMLQIPKTPMRVAELSAIAERLEGTAAREQVARLEGRIKELEAR